MNVWGSGYITQIIYAATTGSAAHDAYAILTEDSQIILTEAGKNLDIEHS